MTAIPQNNPLTGRPYGQELMDAKAFDLRKPSERPNIKDFFPTDAQISDVHDEITTAPRLYAYMQAIDNYIDSLEVKPSQPETNVGEAVEELVKKIEWILNENRETDSFNRTALDWRNFHSVATEIATLMQPDNRYLSKEYFIKTFVENIGGEMYVCEDPHDYSFGMKPMGEKKVIEWAEELFNLLNFQQPDKELLEALKDIQKLSNIRGALLYNNIASKAIFNYEKHY